jgi:hypothetical protein
MDVKVEMISRKVKPDYDTYWALINWPLQIGKELGWSVSDGGDD